MNFIQRIFGKKEEKSNVADAVFIANQAFGTFAGGYRAFQGLSDTMTPTKGIVKNYELGLAGQCIDVIADYFAMSLPIMSQIKSQIDTPKLPSHPFVDVMLQPNDFTTTYDLLSDSMKDMMYYGNAYWYCFRKGGVLENIYRLPADRIEIQRTKNETIYVLQSDAQKNFIGNDTININKTTFSQDEIIDFSKNSIDSNKNYGISKLWTAGQYIDVEFAILRYIKSAFDNASSLGKAISPKEKVEDEKWEAFMKHFQQVFKSANNAEKDLLTNIELNIQDIGKPGRESSFVKTLELAQVMIMGHFGVPKFILSRTDGQYVGSNVEAVRNFMSITIQPLIVFFSNEIDKYVKENYGNKVKFALDIFWPREKNETTDKQDAKELYNLGLITENGLLAAYGRPPKKDGDRYINEPVQEV